MLKELLNARKASKKIINVNEIKKSQPTSLEVYNKYGTMGVRGLGKVENGKVKDFRITSMGMMLKR